MIPLTTALEQGLTPDIIDDTNPNDIYLGFFRYNRNANPNHCLIKRITKATIDGDTITLIKFPFGKFDFLFNWAERKNYTDWRHRDFRIPAIGDLFGGGIVYYIASDSSFVLVCSENDLGASQRFCLNEYQTNPFVPIAGISHQSQSIGDPLVDFGLNNTNLIVTALDALGQSNYAAKICKEYGNNWYLPTANELQCMMNNLKTFNINFHDGNAYSDCYWTSSSANSPSKVIYRILYNHGNPSWNPYDPDYNFGINDFRFGYIRASKKVTL